MTLADLPFAIPEAMLDTPVPSQGSPFLNASARRLNSLLTAIPSPTRYLEVGVETGQTFFEISADFKTAVDPKFLFDRESAPKGDSIEYFETTSDRFFCNVKRDFKYDLVFLDGLHTWEQTYRDFCNTLLITHERSIILLDDIFPSDVFSCNRDQVEAVMMRQFMAGDPSNAWHGDTYKIIPLIRTFHPLLSYCTIITDGNPQALVWRSPQPAIASPILREVGELNMPALDYLWFLRHQESYNLMNEQEALALVIRSLQLG
ncbi:class I SAM-dependent methyltransferase [Aphanothece minutissima]|uniref:class I SAM-dependent methyltransferase n=1 Tax=Aphanothece minutissima TaxID=543815 RepID=UPI0011B21049|nr:class I SAM-dependent methyltransferase [Aphanothece minutissima]